MRSTEGSLALARSTPSLVNAMSYDEGVSGGYSARKKAWDQAIGLIHDLELIKVAQSEAEKFKYDRGDEHDV